MTDEIDWDPIRALARRVLREGEPFVFSTEVRDLLRRTAPEVGIAETETERALMTEAEALELLRESARRIKEGSSRLVNALHRMYKHKEARDFDSARQEMRDVLAVEVVPLYRKTAQDQLDDMADEP